MSLVELETRIRNFVEEHEGILDLAGIEEPAVNHILQTITAALSLADPDISSDDKSLRIKGTIDLPTTLNIQADLCFELGDGPSIETCSLYFETSDGDGENLMVELGGQVLLALKSDTSMPAIDFTKIGFTCKPATKEITLEIKSTESWSPFGESLDLTIRDVDIRISRSGDEASGTTLKELNYSGHLSGTLIVGQASLEISASFPELVLSIDIENLDFATLFADLGLTDISEFLGSFTPIDTPAFDFHLDYTAATKAFSLDFSTSGDWKILESPDIFINPSIHVKREIPAPGKDLVMSTSLSGIMKIGKMDVEVAVNFPDPVFSIDIYNLDFASLFSDLGLTEISDFLINHTPTSASPSFDIHFHFVYNTKSFLFRMTSSNDWIIIDKPAITFTPLILISKESASSVSTILQGTLKMGMISGSITAVFPNPTITIDIQDIGLTSMITSLGFPEISNFINSISPITIPLFDINLEYVPSTKAYTLNVTTDGEWRLVEGLDVFLNPTITVTGIGKTVGPIATLHGYSRIASTKIGFTMVLTDPNPIFNARTTLDFRAIASDLGIAPLLELQDNFSLPTDLQVKLTLAYVPATKEFQIDIEPVEGLSVPYFNFSIDDVKIRITKVLNELNQMVFSVNMQGIFNVGELPITVWCKFPGEFEIKATVPLSLNLATFVGDCLKVFNIAVPAGLTEIGILELNKLELRVIPQRPLFSAVVTTKSGEIELVIRKDADGNWMKALALPLGLNNSLSMMNVPQLPELVSAAISNPALILSTAKLKRPADQTQQPFQSFKLVTDLIPGFNFQASFKDDWITDLLNVDSLSIAGYIGLKPFSLEFLAMATTVVNLWDIFFLKGYDFRIKYATDEFEVGVGANMDLRIGQESVPLRAAIRMEFGTAMSLMFEADMTEPWKDPFNLKGLTLNDLGVGFGITKPFLPTFNFHVGVTIGSFTGSGVLSLKGTALQLLSVQFNELNIGTVVRSLLSVVVENIPEAFFTILDGISMDDVKFHYALTDTTVGGIDYGIGFHMKAILNFFDFRIYAEALLDLDDGMRIYAAMDPLNITVNGFEMIKLTHATDPSKGAMVDLDLRRSSDNLQLMVSGAISILGGLMTGLVDINIDDTGFDFLAECNIFDLFKASLEVRGPSFENLLNGSGDGVYLKAYMRNDLLTFIREEILKFIRDVTESVVTELNNAQNALIQAQHEVENWDTQITEMVAIVEREQDAVIAGLEAAQNAVTGAQNEVDKIVSQINSCYSRINTLNSQIAWWNNWYNSAPWWEKTWKWPILVYEVGWRSAEITAQYVAIGALQVARAAAWAVLEIAKTALKIAQAIVVIADPSLDPRVLFLVASRAVAWTALKIAEGVVIAARAIVSGFSSLTQFVVEWGLGGAFDIKSATFTADFANTRGRIVTINADIIFIGISTNIDFSFNFDDLTGSIISLAGQIFNIGGVELPS